MHSEGAVYLLEVLSEEDTSRGNTMTLMMICTRAPAAPPMREAARIVSETSWP
jgi:hypothetical protein